MRDELTYPDYRVVIVTLDQHAAGPVARMSPRLTAEFPGLKVDVFAAAEWECNPDALAACKAAVAQADMIIGNLIFLESQLKAITPALRARRASLDAFVGVVADQDIVRLTKMGDLDMSKPSSAAVKLLKKLRGSSNPSAKSGAKQMKMLRRLPKMLRLIPGKAQDLRAWFLCMQYWLGGSDENIEQMLRMLIGRYAKRAEWRGVKAEAPKDYPDVALYHPDLPGIGITTNPQDLPKAEGTRVGVLMLRSYILAGDTAHYDAVIRAFEAKGMRPVPAFAGGLDGRPAMDAYFSDVDAVVSLTGFSLVGGPAYNDNDAAIEALTRHDVPYLNAQPLEFQTIEHWAEDSQGLGPVETTMLVALPEIDGAIAPTVFAGRHGSDIDQGHSKAMAPCPERIESLAEKTRRIMALRRKANRDKSVAIVLFGFPPNAGAVGTAAYLSVFESLLNTLQRMKRDGYDVDVPDTVEDLRAIVMQGNAAQYGQEANVAAHVSADKIVSDTAHLAEIEAVWGPAPGKVQSDGRGVFVLGAHLGNVFVGVQPTFGYEGDPMRLLFEKGFAPTHAFAQFYRWIRDDYKADAVLHFGMHGALEFMPGKQAGLSGDDWPERLIGDLPNIYLYAANNPSEATLAKRRSGAVIVTHLTPPLQSAGLYKGLADLKDTLSRWRALPADDPDRAELETLIADQADVVDMKDTAPEDLWLALLETEDALIFEGLHVVGRAMPDDEVDRMLNLMTFENPADRETAGLKLREDGELDGLMRALSARYIAPVPGGDIIRSPQILPTGRNIHAFDPFRMPTAFAMRDGERQADLLLKTHDSLPRTVALVLWGSDNIKSDGVPISQALALIGATPRFDNFGRLSGADLIPLEQLGRPRIDVIMTLSGIFRDLLPLQTRMLAEASYKAATADEPLNMNFVRAHALAYSKQMDCDLETAALRVFSNAEGAYGSNVNALVDSSAFEAEDELADAYEARKSFAYGTDGKASKHGALLQAALKNVDVAYQNLESVELGVTTVDHYFDTLGGIARAVKRAKGGESAAVYIGDQTRGAAKVRTLQDQVALETRSRALNPRFYEALLKHGHEGVRQIEAHITNTVGWSATTGDVEPWVYQKLSETFVLDPEMRDRLAALNPQASVRMASRLLEASDRAYWQPDEETLAGLQDAADALEDRLEGIAAE